MCVADSHDVSIAKHVHLLSDAIGVAWQRKRKRRHAAEMDTMEERDEQD